MTRKNNRVPAEDSEDTFKASERNANESTIKKPKKYRIVFKHNRPKELYVGREKLVFGPHGEDTVDEDFRNHKDFLSQEKYFNVMEVK